MTLRVGVIGVGRIGAAHARDLATGVAGATVSAVYDVDATRAAFLAQELGARALATPADLVASADVDAVVVASPDALHPEHVRLCLAQDTPVLCEKPLAPVVADALAIVETEAALGRRLVTLGFMRRFDAGYRALKARLDSGEAGTPLLVHCIHRNVSAGPGQTSAMTLTNSVVHEIDASRWLLGEDVVSVRVVTGRSTPLAEAGLQDPLQALLRTTSGVVVDVEAFVNAHYGYDVRCEVVGSEGALDLGDGAGVAPGWLERFADAYHAELQAWVDAVVSGVPAGASAWDGYVATAVAQACERALGTDGEVPVALAPRPDLYG